MDSYNSYFDYWKATSDNICDCCKNAVYFKCEAEDCEYYYKLTDDEIKAKNYSNLYHITWDCTNTDNFEYCKKFQDSVCSQCLFTSDFPEFESNGKIY